MSETRTEFKYEPRLHGWDDEKVYFYDESGVEWCGCGLPSPCFRAKTFDYIVIGRWLECYLARDTEAKEAET